MEPGSRRTNCPTVRAATRADRKGLTMRYWKLPFRRHEMKLLGLGMVFMMCALGCAQYPSRALLGRWASDSEFQIFKAEPVFLPKTPAGVFLFKVKQERSLPVQGFTQKRLLEVLSVQPRKVENMPFSNLLLQDIVIPKRGNTGWLMEITEHADILVIWRCEKLGDLWQVDGRKKYLVGCFQMDAYMRFIHGDKFR